MRRNLSVVVALALLLPGAAGPAFAGAVFLGPVPGSPATIPAASLSTGLTWRRAPTARWPLTGAPAGIAFPM